MASTRPSLDGYGARRAGSFAGRGLSLPVGIITRLHLDGYGARRAGNFAGRVEIIALPTGGGWLRHSTLAARQHAKAAQIQAQIHADDDEILETITIIMATKEKWEV